MQLSGHSGLLCFNLHDGPSCPEPLRSPLCQTEISPRGYVLAGHLAHERGIELRRVLQTLGVRVRHPDQ